MNSRANNQQPPSNVAEAAASRQAFRRSPLRFIISRVRRRDGLSVQYPPPDSSTEILRRLADLPVSTWSYGWDDSSVRHLGPMAQDFAQAFGLGDSDKHIYTVDAQGVLFAAVKALHAQLRALESEVAELRSLRSSDTTPSS